MSLVLKNVELNKVLPKTWVSSYVEYQNVTLTRLEGIQRAFLGVVDSQESDKNNLYARVFARCFKDSVIDFNSYEAIGLVKLVCKTIGFSSKDVLDYSREEHDAFSRLIAEEDLVGSVDGICSQIGSSDLLQNHDKEFSIKLSDIFKSEIKNYVAPRSNVNLNDLVGFVSNDDKQLKELYKGLFNFYKDIELVEGDDVTNESFMDFFELVCKKSCLSFKECGVFLDNEFFNSYKGSLNTYYDDDLISITFDVFHDQFIKRFKVDESQTTSSEELLATPTRRNSASTPSTPLLDDTTRIFTPVKNADAVSLVETVSAQLIARVSVECPELLDLLTSNNFIVAFIDYKRCADICTEDFAVASFKRSVMGDFRKIDAIDRYREQLFSPEFFDNAVISPQFLNSGDIVRKFSIGDES